MSGTDLAAALARAQQVPPDEVLTVLAAVASRCGGERPDLLLLDYGQAALLPPSGSELSPAAVEGTTAGSCYASQSVLAETTPDGLRAYVPVTERANRLGVLAVALPGREQLDEQDEAVLVELGLLAAQLVVTARAYGDGFQRQRRSEPMALAAEMQWSLLPPLSFSCPGVQVTGMLEPAYDVGGDSLDYALNGSVLSFGIFDAMGHGLGSAVLSSLAVGAYRHLRREGASLSRLREGMDAALSEQFEDVFVTALTAELDVGTGVLAWHCAGHPQPLLLRAGEVLAGPDERVALPLGLGVAVGDDSVAPRTVQLESGDAVLLYTDGVIEGRDDGGEQFGLRQLGEHVLQGLRTGFPANEVLRTLVQALRSWQAGDLRDDAALLLVQWTGPPGD